ncbi:MAG: DUF4209 domain-containing protein [Spirulina sp.]
MSPLNPPLTKDDFNNACWQDVVNGSKRKDCLSYDSAFWKKSQEAQEAGNLRDQAVFVVLAAVTSAAIKPESTEEFFADIFKNLTDDQLDFLADIAPEISDPELQARVADILWIRRRDYRMAQLAIPAYLQSATTLENPEHWTHCVDRMERALRLARKIRHEDEVVFSHIEAVLDRYNGEDPLWLSAKLMELLQEYRFGDPAKYAALSEKAAILAESSSDWRRARTLWGIKAVWHRMEKDYSKELDASMSAAETYVKEAQAALTRTPPSYMVASHFLQHAVEAFRSIRGTKEETVDAKARAEEVHKLLLQYQEETRNEMITSSHEMDISELVEEARNHVRGKGFQEALFALALLGAPTDVSQLKQQVQQQAREFVASHLFPVVMMNEMGKVTARQPGSVLSSNPEEAEAATRFEMCRNAIYYQNLQAQAYVEPARYQINLEHSVRLNDILSIISHSPFVPPEREYLFAKGLYAGLTGDFFTSTHILIPQIENSVRYIMWRRRIITSGLDDSGIQNEHNLNSTLYRPEITSIFDENTLFDLKCLLVEHAGSNLRNRMAHGLINDGEFMSPLMSYIWWLTLRLCCLPILIHQQRAEQSNSSTDAI